MSTAMTSRNSVIVPCTPRTVVFRSAPMSLIITFMFEPAKLQMNWARASGASGRRGAAARSWAAGVMFPWSPLPGPASAANRQKDSTVICPLL
ncbi:hypothetical protein AB0G05_04195 [Nonomuraea wenchangensis]